MLTIYFKRKAGVPLTKKEQRVWEEFKKHIEEELPFSEEDLEMLTRYEQQMLPWEQFREKHNIGFVDQKPQAFGRVHRLQPVLHRLAIAISLLLFIPIVWWSIARNRHPPDQAQPLSTWKRLLTARRTVDSVQLDDGTKIWLNAETGLRYPANFGSGERVVVLEKGEALFDVAHRPAQPFIVRCNDHKIKVLGTRFNIAYREKEVVTTLLEGSLRVIRNSNSLLLKPEQQARLDSQGQLSASPANVKEAIAWKNNYFTFADKPLSEIMNELAQWYGMELIYLHPVQDEHFVINEYPRNESLTGLLEILEASRLAHFEVKGTKIYISPWQQ